MNSFLTESASKDEYTSKSNVPVLRRQSSTTRKQLPSIPDPDAQLTLANKMIDKKTSTPKGYHSYSPFFQEYSILAEYNQTQLNKPPGVYVIPSANSPLLWHGVLFIRHGLYQEGVFRFMVTIPENFPDGDCPGVKFQPAIFHPLIDPDTGDLDVQRAFPRWRRHVNHIYQVLVFARRIFFKIDAQDPLNKEAATLYENDLPNFKKKVSETIKMCKDRLYDAPVESDDSHAIRFTQWDPSIHEEIRQQALCPQEKFCIDRENNSLSWMRHGSTQIFSREDAATA